MEISEQIQVLSDKVDLINQNYQFTITLTVSLISLAIAFAGVALYKLTRIWVNKRVDKELEKIKEGLMEESHKFILDNESYVIRAWDDAIVTSSVAVDGEWVYYIPVHGGTENLLYPPIVSLYRKNKLGEKTPVTNYYITKEINHSNKIEGENRIYICIKDKFIDCGFSYIVMWEKDKDNNKVRL